MSHLIRYALYLRLKLLSVAGIAAAVKNFIEKSDGAAIPSIVERQGPIVSR